MAEDTTKAIAIIDGEMRRPRGRPPLNIDPQKLEAAASIQCTLKELAAIFECSVDVLKNGHDANGTPYRATIQQGRERGKMSLRRMQWKRGTAGSDRMLIHLGQQYLGQSIQQRTEVTGAGGGPLQIDSTTDNGVAAVMAKLNEIAERSRNAKVEETTERREHVRIARIG